jgi:hypothetical protein
MRKPIRPISGEKVIRATALSLGLSVLPRVGDQTARF